MSNLAIKRNDEIVNEFDFRFVSDFSSEVIDDFNPPLSSEQIELLTLELQNTEDEIGHLEYHSKSVLSEDHELNQRRNDLLQLFQNDAEWRKAHPINW